MPGDWKFLLSSLVWLGFHSAWQGMEEGPGCLASEQALHSWSCIQGSLGVGLVRPGEPLSNKEQVAPC